MGETVVRVLTDIAKLMTIEPFVYITGTVIVSCCVVIMKKMF